MTNSTTAAHRVYGDGTTTKEAPMERTEIRIEHPALPFGYADGYLVEGLFVTRRNAAGWLWDVWVSVEAFATLSDNPASLVAGNLSRAAALAVAEGAVR